MCLLSVQITIAMDGGEENKSSKRMQLNPGTYKQIQNFFVQKLRNKELEKQKKEVENQLKKQKQENQELKIKIARQKLFRKKKASRIAGVRKPYRKTRNRRTRTSHH